ncbi:MAG: hypothetical protein ACLVLG_10270 [Anaerovoracaceae bacterium]
MKKQPNLGSCFLYSSSAENRTKKKGSQQPSFLGNKNPNVSMGSQQGVFSQKENVSLAEGHVTWQILLYYPK